MLHFTLIFLHGHVAKARRLAREDQRGASVLEWALIAAVVVVAAAIIGSVVYNLVQDKSDELDKCARQGPGSTC